MTCPIQTKVGLQFRNSRSSFVSAVRLRRTTSLPHTANWAIPVSPFIGGAERRGPHDGDAWLEVGYCLQYGVGIRRNAAAAIRAYRRAIACDHTTEYGCEEAQYHLAVALLDRGLQRSRREVERLLNLADEHQDYPRASDLLAQLGKKPLRICRCRWALARRLGGKTHCLLHRGVGTRKPV